MNRIVLVLHSFPKLSETFIVNKFLALADAGYDIHLLCSESSEQEWNWFPQLSTIPNVRQRIHLVKTNKAIYRLLLNFFILLFRSLRTNPSGTLRYFFKRILSRKWRIIIDFLMDAYFIILQPTILHFEFGTLAAEKIYIKDYLSVKVVTSFRGYDISYYGLDVADYYAETWEKSDLIHFLSHDLWENALRRACPKDKAHVFITPAINPVFFTRDSERLPENLGTQERPLRILSVGRLHWKKGYEYALRAVDILRREGIHFEYRIIGAGNYQSMLEFCREVLNLDEQVLLLGAQSPQRVKETMEWADIFLHTAVSEGFCNAVLEAQAMELPVITTDAHGLAENVAHEESGYVVRRRNVQELARTMIELVHDPEKRQKMAKLGRERVKHNFQISQQANAFDEIYKNLMG